MNRSEAVPGQTFLEKKVLCGKENRMAADSQGKQEETSMKVAVVTDSNSGITQAQAKEMGASERGSRCEHIPAVPGDDLKSLGKTFGGIRCSCAHSDVQWAFELLPDGKDAGR